MKHLMVAMFVAASLFLSHHAFSQNGQWYDSLPACPCKNPDINGVIAGDGWAKDKGSLDKYHKGAATSFRSYPAVQTSAGMSGQQCCYDSSGNLITEGRGAGTPDKESTCKGEKSNGVMKVRYVGVFGHLKKDVRPWKEFMRKNNEGWQLYNATWPPNNGNNCKPM